MNKYCLVANDQLRGNFKTLPFKCPFTVAAPLKGIHLAPDEITWIPVVRRLLMEW